MSEMNTINKNIESYLRKRSDLEKVIKVIKQVEMDEVDDKLAQEMWTFKGPLK